MSDEKSSARQRLLLSHSMTRRSTALITAALLLVAVTAFETSTSTEVDPVVDPEHPDTKILRSICGACEGHLVFPNNGSNTHQHKICFDRVDQMCHSDLEDKYSFCGKVTLDGDDQEHGMNHVIEVCRLVATSRLVRVSRDLSLSTHALVFPLLFIFHSSRIGSSSTASGSRRPRSRSASCRRMRMPSWRSSSESG